MSDDGTTSPSGEPGGPRPRHRGGPRPAAVLRRRGWLTWAAPAAAVLVLGGGAGAVTAAAVAAGGGSGGTATTPGASGVPASGTFASARHRLTIEQIYRRAAPGVVQVDQGRGEGSGFVIDRKGDIVTNAHVVSGKGPITVSFSNDDQVPATRVGLDETTDVALLRVSVPASALVPLPLGDSSTLRVGDSVVAIGNPFGLDRSATDGIVSALDRQIGSPNGYAIDGAIQTDAAINHGNSGGPLINAQGQVIGITSQIADSGVDANVGVGFAVPINTVKQIVADLEATGSVSHAWLGVSLAPVDPTIAARADLPVDHGAMVLSVRAGSPAASAGLTAATRRLIIDGTSYGAGGDIVTAIDGTPVRTPEDLQSAIEGLRAGDHASLTVVHPGGSVATVAVTLGLQPRISPSVLPY